MKARAAKAASATPAAKAPVSRPTPKAGKGAASDEALLAVGAIDGRYRGRTRALEPYFSEFALMRYRVRVEVEWYLWLAAEAKVDALGPLAAPAAGRLRQLYAKFSLEDARRIKEIEAATNHDVKAVEYFLKERLGRVDGSLPVEMVHFGCTSEDINNLAYALILKEFVNGELLPRLGAAVDDLRSLAHRYKGLAMLARTHGQEASPTTVGKEFAVFASRLERQLRNLRRQEYLGKFNGAVGNFNAHQFAYPEVDWIECARGFVESIGLTWNALTTQIESHDFIAELLDTVVRIDTILLDLARDMWGYIALDYFTQKAVAGETGSSTMPHKVNPIDFENCEGNLGIASALFQHLAAKLPVSRWQRDLSDSTALRALGTAFGHLIVALWALKRGLERVEVNEARIGAALAEESAWEVVAEAIQTLMRRHGLPRPYETLKEMTRGKPIDSKALRSFMASLPLSGEARRKLERLSPRAYLGLAQQLVERFIP